MAKTKAEHIAPMGIEPLPLGDVEPLPPALSAVSPGHEHPEVERLRRELADKAAALKEVQEQLAATITPLKPLPEDGPGRYRVVLRHAPGRFKRLEIDADSPLDAWNKFVQAAMERNNNPKDPERRELKAFENFIRRGRFDGYDRDIKKLEPATAAA